ncbi:heme-dependent peroxidase [Acidipila sp. 4G-K13]|uniref:Heme-dependent peroxidase n=1 Tax=Paracidobacterium acidisoli TaxID=2303751 RepID=A0A372IU70_9BACT|nr:heme-dependent peroxidase [Paracidobacterium acidisoli]
MSAALPAVPLTLEGASVLHQMFRFDWAAWRLISAEERAGILAEVTALLAPLEKATAGDHPAQSAVFAQLGHKGDLMLVHFRDSIAQLAAVERDLARTAFGSFLTAQHSYLSVVELGLYESSNKTYAALAEEGIEQYSEEWNRRLQEVIGRQSAAMSSRLFPAIPDAKYLCFYPMDRRRGEQLNWYTVSMTERQRMMHDHGMIGRRYAGEVRQIITGSIGYDDWEWGVDLFSDNQNIFKKLIYEMRFDEASALYALFGAFYVGVRLPVSELAAWLAVDTGK